MEKGQKVIVRSVQAGVFYGTFVSRVDDVVTLIHARKLHSWEGAGAVEGLAVQGPQKPQNCRFTVWVEELEIFGVCQILPCTAEAQRAIEGVEEWRL